MKQLRPQETSIIQPEPKSHQVYSQRVFWIWHCAEVPGQSTWGRHTIPSEHHVTKEVSLGICKETGHWTGEQRQEEQTETSRVFIHQDVLAQSLAWNQCTDVLGIVSIIPFRAARQKLHLSLELPPPRRRCTNLTPAPGIHNSQLGESWKSFVGGAKGGRHEYHGASTMC